VLQHTALCSQESPSPLELRSLSVLTLNTTPAYLLRRSGATPRLWRRALRTRLEEWRTAGFERPWRHRANVSLGSIRGCVVSGKAYLCRKHTVPWSFQLGLCGCITTVCRSASPCFRENNRPAYQLRNIEDEPRPWKRHVCSRQRFGVAGSVLQVKEGMVAAGARGWCLLSMGWVVGN
jgi:hypothetical protein